MALTLHELKKTGGWKACKNALPVAYSNLRATNYSRQHRIIINSVTIYYKHVITNFLSDNYQWTRIKNSTPEYNAKLLAPARFSHWKQ